MPLPTFLPSLIGALGGIASNVISNKGAKKRENQARTYNTAQWERVNEYNHPISQMERLKNAGLNPNLIYGSSPGSAVGNAGAIAPGKAPDYSINNPMTAFMDTSVKQAQTNNLDAQSNLNNVKALESIASADLTKTQAQNLKNLIGGNLELQQSQIQQAKEQAFQEVLKSKAMSDVDKGIIAKYGAEAQTAISNRNIAKAKEDLAKLDSKLAQKGIRPNDSIWIRIFSQVLGLDLTNNSKVSKQDAKSVNGFLNELYKQSKQ